MPRKALSAVTVVLDANVLVQASVRDTLLRLAEEPALYRPLWSVEIMAEVSRTLQSKFHIEPHRTTRLEAALREHFPEAWVEDYKSLVPEMNNDAPRIREALPRIAEEVRCHTFQRHNRRPAARCQVRELIRSRIGHGRHAGTPAQRLRHQIQPQAKDPLIRICPQALRNRQLMF